MRVLVGIASHSHAKDYMHEKLAENMYACVMRPGIDVVSFGDRHIPNLHNYRMQSVPSTYQDDMTYQSREAIRVVAKDKGYDAFIWQGSDCLYESRESFERFLSRVFESDYDAVGALTAGRNKPGVPVARRFTVDHHQTEIPADELESGKIVEAGFPGADALVVKSKLFDQSWMNWEYTPWYRSETKLCVEEFWCKTVQKKGFRIGLDTSTKTWHVHENGMASMYPDGYIHMEDLEWEVR